MLRKELLNELKQLVELEFNVVDEAFAMANEIDLESFSTMTPARQPLFSHSEA